MTAQSTLRQRPKLLALASRRRKADGTEFVDRDLPRFPEVLNFLRDVPAVFQQLADYARRALICEAALCDAVCLVQTSPICMERRSAALTSRVCSGLAVSTSWLSKCRR